MLIAPKFAGHFYSKSTLFSSAVDTQAGTQLTSGAANTKGNWFLVETAGGTPDVDWDMLYVVINGVETSGGVITATTLNVMVDIGVGTSTSAVNVIAENLGASQSQGVGTMYVLPVRQPRNYGLYARMQCTAASALCGVAFIRPGGFVYPGAYPSVRKIVSLGTTLASTTGTSITPGNAAAGAWTQIVASSAERYVGFIVSPLFNVDTSLTSGLVTTLDVGIGANPNERSLNIAGTRSGSTISHIWSTAEQRVALCFPVLADIPAGTRLSVRASGSTAPDGTNSVVLYGMVR